MQEELKPMTLDELMGNIKRQPFTLPDGKQYKLKNAGELTPNQRRDLTETHTRLLTAGSYSDVEEEFADTAHLLDLMFHDRIPEGLADDIAVDWVAHLLDFFYFRATPEQEVARLRRMVRELTDGQQNGDTFEAASSDSTE